MPQQTSTESEASNLALTGDEVRRLLEDRSPATLVDITGKLAQAYSSQPLKVGESQAAEQIFRMLLRETELRVRITLAQQVKDNTHIPKDIVMSMARDVEEVALPILQYSEVLNDNDLLELVESTKEIKRYMAISKREHVSPAVSDSLLAKGNSDVAATLVNNTGAHISEAGFSRIIGSYSGNESLMQAVGNRPQLPPTVTEKLISVVSSSLAETLKQKHKLPSKEIEQEIEKTRETETLNLVRITHADEEIDKLVIQLKAYQRLTPSLILSALSQGNLAFFEISLARMAEVPISNARKLISDKGELGFRGLYNRSGLPETMFPAVRLLLKVIRGLNEDGEKMGTQRYTNRTVELLLQYSETEPVENLSYIIALARRHMQ